MGKDKIIIAVACQDTMKAKTCLSLVNALRGVDFDYDMVMRQGCDLIGSRVGLVRMAQNINGTHILFLDHDMFLNPVGDPVTRKMISPITKLLSNDKDIIGGQYNFRQLPLHSTAIPLDTQPKDGKYIVDSATLPKEPFKCLTIATGFLLIKLSVFEKVPEPWFLFGRDKRGEMLQGEDTHFCLAARKAGFDIWCDPTILIGHIGEYNF